MSPPKTRARAKNLGEASKANSQLMPRPTTLTDLPQELLQEIVLHLDKTSGLAFALVAPSLTSVADYAIWRDIDVSLSPYYGVRPQIPRYAPDKPQAQPAAVKAADRAEKAHRKAIKARATKLIKVVESLPSGVVKSVRLVPRPGTAPKMVELLEAVSEHLEHLEIQAPAYHPPQNIRRAEIPDTIDYHLIHSDIWFPALTHLRLGPHATRFFDLVPFLLVRAPFLEHLDVSIDVASFAKSKDLDIPDSPDLKEYHEVDDDEEDEEEFCFVECLTLTVPTESPYDIYGMYDSVPVLVEIIHLVSSIRRLSMAFPMASYAAVEGGDRKFDLDDQLEPLRNAVGYSPELEDLDWRVSPHDFCQFMCIRGWDDEDEDENGDEAEEGSAMGPLGPGFKWIRRLVLGPAGWNDVITDIPELPSLESIYLRPLPGSAVTAIPSLPHKPSVQGMIREYAKQLRASPKLHTIHTLLDTFDEDARPTFDKLDNIERSNRPNGLIYSYTHKGADVLHARILMFMEEVEDSKWDWMDYWSGEEDCCTGADGKERFRTVYTTKHGNDRVKYYQHLDQPVWVDYTDYKGKMVPMEIIEEMREAEGLGQEEWEKRGVAVGEKGWKILREWYEGASGRRQGSKCECTLIYRISNVGAQS